MQRPDIFKPFKDFGDITVSKFLEPNFKALFEGMIKRAASSLDENYTQRRDKVLKLKEEL